MKKFFFFILLLPLLFALGCGGRLPSTHATTSILRHHFNKYARKYEKSPFGNKKVLSIEILKLEEIHKNLAAVSAFLTMEGTSTELSTGRDVYKVRVLIEKHSLGWRFLSWENLSGS